MRPRLDPGSRFLSDCSCSCARPCRTDGACRNVEWRESEDVALVIEIASPMDGEYTATSVVQPGESALVDFPFPVEIVPESLVD